MEYITIWFKKDASMILHLMENFCMQIRAKQKGFVRIFSLPLQLYPGCISFTTLLFIVFKLLTLYFPLHKIQDY